MIELTKTEFDRLAKAGEFVDGPYVDGLGDGLGEPYIPDRKAKGKLKGGLEVRAWVRGKNVRET